MQTKAEVKEYDVVIAGAGPAGSTCALALKDAGLKVCLLDKESFPRDKVCGDAIPGRAIKTLKNISADFATDFNLFPGKLQSKKTTLGYKGQVLEIAWVMEAFTCARTDFDNFLFSLVKKHTPTDIYTGITIGEVSTDNHGVTLTDKEGKLSFRGKILIGADGAQSVAAKRLINKTLDRNHHVGSVRAYYSDISITDPNTTEIYFDKKYLPSYLWIFPLPGNKANVGFGMLSNEIAKRKINLKKTFYDFIEESPVLKEKFRNAQPISPLEGFGLPLGSRRIQIAGDRFMLTGDAASLIDPISGDGIGNAMLSGRLAASRVIQCFKQADFSAQFMQGYEQDLFKIIGQELKNHSLVQRTVAGMPFLLDILFAAGKFGPFKRLMSKYM